MDQNNWQKNDKNTPVVPMLIRDSSHGRFSQVYQGGSADQQLPGSSCFRRFVRHVRIGLEASD